MAEEKRPPNAWLAELERLRVRSRQGRGRRSGADAAGPGGGYGAVPGHYGYLQPGAQHWGHGSSQVPVGPPDGSCLQ